MYCFGVFFCQQPVLQTAIITLVSRSFHTMMFAHARHVILDTRLLSLPASLTVLETASLIYAELASLKIAYLCNFDPLWNALSMKRRQRYGKKLYNGYVGVANF